MQDDFNPYAAPTVTTMHPRAAALAQALLAAVEAFADGTPQQDDMTVVLVKREPC